MLHSGSIRKMDFRVKEGRAHARSKTGDLSVKIRHDAIDVKTQQGSVYIRIKSSGVEVRVMKFKGSEKSIAMDVRVKNNAVQINLESQLKHADRFNHQL